ncbi:MAG: FtsK/SpoIIIE domain-containing protein [Acidimicrobiales bacterium]
MKIDGVTAATTVGDLAEALAAWLLGDDRAWHPAGALSVDGRSVAAADSLAMAGVVSGCTFEISGCRKPGRSPGTDVASRDEVGAFELVVTAGLDAGLKFEVSAGAHSIGSAPTTATSVSAPTLFAAQASVRCGPGGLQVVDLGSARGLLVNGVAVHSALVANGDLIQVGTTELTVASRLSNEPSWEVGHSSTWHDGVVVFSRSPRPAEVEAMATIEVPDPPADPPGRGSLSLISLIAPLVVAGAMVWVTGSLRYALFALLSPLTMIANGVAARRRRKREARLSVRDFGVALREFEDALVEAAVGERRRRRRRHLDVAEVLDRALRFSSNLWERRLYSDVASVQLQLRLGTGPVDWDPPVDSRRVAAHKELRAAVRSAGRIDQCPVSVDLGPGHCVGLVGDRPAALAVARSLLTQAVVFYGPADVEATIVTAENGARDWDWAKWLPHVTAPGHPARIGPVAGLNHLSALASRQADGPGPADTLPPSTTTRPAHPLVIVDDELLVVGRNDEVRRLLRGDFGPTSVLVLSSTASKLPAATTSIVHLADDEGRGRLEHVDGRGADIELAVAGIGESVARRAARALARFEDPDVVVPRSSLPRRVSITDVVSPAELSPSEILRRWGGRPPSPELSAVVGVSDGGPFSLDLVADGPHALVAGTTGAGKSELLRTIVVSIAIQASPSEVTFVLVDYKGGSAFAECVDLPHTVGMVTDLDGHLSRRALASLHAETRHREELLASAGARDIEDYRRLGSPEGTMPRLVIVLDEFGAIATELPDFLDALVGVAQRGRSLGLHLILATQRPAGVVGPQIKANTNLRIALRTQDGQDSSDVIGSVAAAEIDRHAPGRALVRKGPGETELVQVASVSESAAIRGAGIRVERFGVAAESPQQTAKQETAQSDVLGGIVDAISDAFEKSGLPAPRAPWLPPLPEQLDHHALHGCEPVGSAAATERVPIALADLPGGRSIEPIDWGLLDGSIGFFGSGDDVSDAVASAALSMAARFSPDRLHIYGLEWSLGRLRPLQELRHVGAVVSATETERLGRLVGVLAAEIERRRCAPTDESDDRSAGILLLIEGLDRFVAESNAVGWSEHRATLELILAEGPRVNLVCVASASRLGSVPSRVLAHLPTRFLFAHADRNDFASVGLRDRDLPKFVTGRALRASDGVVCQLPSFDSTERGIERVAARWEGSASTADRIEPLPAVLAVDEVAGVTAEPQPYGLPVGLSAGSREVVSLVIRPGSHALVAGAHGSGVSNTLLLLAAMFRTLDAEVVVVAVGPAGSGILESRTEFDASGSVEELEHVLDAASGDRERRWVVLVDDAHLTYGTPALDGVLSQSPHCSVVAGAPADQLHGRFDHWTRRVRHFGNGLLLQPRLEADGDLLGVRLPRQLSVPSAPGRGFLVRAGRVDLVQIALADCGQGRVEA